MKKLIYFVAIIALFVGCAGSPKTVHALPFSMPDGKTPANNLVTGGQPTVEDLQAAAAAGYKTVVNLRSETEHGYDATEEATVTGLKMKYVHIPVNGPDGVTKENAQLLAQALSGPDAFPAIVHCASGNRAGALLALKAYFSDGKTPDEAVAFGKEAGMLKLESVVRDRMTK